MAARVRLSLLCAPVLVVVLLASTAAGAATASKAAAGPIQRDADEIDTNRANEDPATNPGDLPSMRAIEKPEPVSRSTALIGKARVVVPITEAPTVAGREKTSERGKELGEKGGMVVSGAKVETSKGATGKTESGGSVKVMGLNNVPVSDGVAAKVGDAEQETSDDGGEVITPLFGMDEFNKAVAVKSMVFVKFFSPRCPHCRAMKKAFMDAAELIVKNKLGVRVVEVDCTNYENRPVCDEHVPAGYPTLKIFKNSQLVSEYNGARDVNSMFTWVSRQASFDTAPRVSVLKTHGEVQAFLDRVRDHPVVISAAASDGTRAGLLSEWKVTVDAMRETSAKTVAFGVVESWQLLVGTPKSKLRQSFRKHNVYGVPPFAVAAHTGEKLIEEGADEWFFDGVNGADSLETFMHVATLPMDGRAVLTPENSQYVTATQRVLALLFDKSPGPSWAMETMLEQLGKENVLVPVYASSLKLSDFRSHVGFPPLKQVVSVSDFGRMDFALYRAAGGGVEKVVYKGKGQTVEDMMKWAHGYLKWGVNMTARPTALSDLSTVKKRFGFVPARLDDNLESLSHVSDDAVALRQAPVVDVVASTWSSIVERDGRAVLVLLYSGHCSACRAFLPTFTAVAQKIRRDARSVFAVRMDITDNALPPYIPRPSRVPTVYLLVPGAAPQVFNGPSSVEAIAGFARYGAAPPHVKEVTRLDEFLNPAQKVSPTHGFLWTVLSLGLLVVGSWAISVGVLVELHRFKQRRGSSDQGNGSPTRNVLNRINKYLRFFAIGARRFLFDGAFKLRR